MGFDPDQPRDEHGRWIGDGGLTAESLKGWAAEARERYGLKQLDVYLDHGGNIELSMIEVPTDARKQGVGTRAMEELGRLADRAGKTVWLQLAEKGDGMGTTSRARLMKFYRRFGFVPNKGRTKDYALSMYAAMYRRPKKMQEAFNPDQPRDDHGQWTSGGGSASSKVTDTPAFKRWFGDSKVVDAAGKPLVVYHGGAAGIEAFDPAKVGTVQRSDWGEGIYFTPSEWMADGYRNTAAKEQDPEVKRLWQEYEDAAKRMGTDVMSAAIDLGYDSPKYNELKEYDRRWRARLDQVEKEKRGAVYPVYLKLENPLRYQYEGLTDPFLAERAKAEGHDGVIVYQRDGYGDPRAIDEILVFKPEQIKSAIGNRGTFDPRSPKLSEAFDPNQARDEHGRWTDGGAVMASPNIADQGNTPEKAQGLFKSERHQAFVALTRQILHEVGLPQDNEEPAYGDWADGSEISVLTRIPGAVDRDTMQYVAALLGLAGDQKMVAAFTPDENGPHVRVDFRLPMDWHQAREVLTKAGIEFRTLVPDGDGVRVTALDTSDDRAVTAAAFKLGGEHGAQVSTRIGYADFVGDWDDRQVARGKHEAAIAAYVSRHPDRRHARVRHPDRRWLTEAQGRVRVGRDALREGRFTNAELERAARRQLEAEQSPRRLMFPGGGVEPGEGLQAAAVREVWEETGLPVQLVGYLGDYVDQYAHRRYYIGRALTEVPEGYTHRDVDGGATVRIRAIPIEQAQALLTSPYDQAALAVLRTQLANGRCLECGKPLPQRLREYDPGQARDASGRWTSDGGAAEKQTETPEFKRWFGKSKVVTPDGKPLVVFKGMPGHEMGPYKRGEETKFGAQYDTIRSTGALTKDAFGKPVSLYATDEPPLPIHGGFFSHSPKVASEFAELYLNHGGAVFPVYLSIERPFEIDAKGGLAGAFQFGATGKPFRDAARSGKYDGIIIRNTRDEGDIYIAFQPEQIKSAIGNRGTFDPRSPKLSEADSYFAICPRDENGRCLPADQGDQSKSGDEVAARAKELVTSPTVMKRAAQKLGLEKVAQTLADALGDQYTAQDIIAGARAYVNQYQGRGQGTPASDDEVRDALVGGFTADTGDEIRPLWTLSGALQKAGGPESVPVADKRQEALDALHKALEPLAMDDARALAAQQYGLAGPSEEQIAERAKELVKDPAVLRQASKDISANDLAAVMNAAIKEVRGEGVDAEVTGVMLNVAANASATGIGPAERIFVGAQGINLGDTGLSALGLLRASPLWATLRDTDGEEREALKVALRTKLDGLVAPLAEKMARDAASAMLTGEPTPEQVQGEISRIRREQPQRIADAMNQAFDGKPLQAALDTIKAALLGATTLRTDAKEVLGVAAVVGAAEEMYKHHPTQWYDFQDEALPLVNRQPLIDDINRAGQERLHKLAWDRNYTLPADERQAAADAAAKEWKPISSLSDAEVRYVLSYADAAETPADWVAADLSVGGASTEQAQRQAALLDYANGSDQHIHDYRMAAMRSMFGQRLMRDPQFEMDVVSKLYSTDGESLLFRGGGAPNPEMVGEAIDALGERFIPKWQAVLEPEVKAKLRAENQRASLVYQYEAPVKPEVVEHAAQRAAELFPIGDGSERETYERVAKDFYSVTFSDPTDAEKLNKLIDDAEASRPHLTALAEKLVGSPVAGGAGGSAGEPEPETISSWEDIEAQGLEDEAFEHWAKDTYNDFLQSEQESWGDGDEPKIAALNKALDDADALRGQLIDAMVEAGITRESAERAVPVGGISAGTVGYDKPDWDGAWDGSKYVYANIETMPDGHIDWSKVEFYTREEAERLNTPSGLSNNPKADSDQEEPVTIRIPEGVPWPPLPSVNEDPGPLLIPRSEQEHAYQRWVAEGFQQTVEQYWKENIYLHAQELLDNGEIEAPDGDYFADSINDFQKEMWAQKSDAEKWSQVSTYYEDTEKPSSSSDDDEDSEPSGPLKWPQTFKVFQNGEDYQRTKAIARRLANERFAELAAKRMEEHYPNTAQRLSPEQLLEQTRGIGNDVARKVWGAWKSDSGSELAWALQIAAAEELGAKWFKTRPGDAYSPEGAKKWADAHLGGHGWDNLKTYVRAQWETSQWLLHQADVPFVPVYRAIYGDVRPEDVQNVPMDNRGDGLTPRVYGALPHYKLQRNGAASWSTKLDVVNAWNGVGHKAGDTRVVLRGRLPKEAVLSLPVFGQNVYGELEVVAAGLGIPYWDAWKDKAPSFEEFNATRKDRDRRGFFKKRS